MSKAFIFFLLLVALPNLGMSQFPFYKNFNINDGLVSNKIYNIIEDKQGFIWFCTDQGVSRYDGIKFQNFTTKDGLPDNEVINLFEDSKGRIWFNGFSAEPCYYYSGKIYNASNEPFLKRIKSNKLPGVCSYIIIEWNNSTAYIVNEKGKKFIIGKDIEDIEIKTKDKLQEYIYQYILTLQNKHYQLFSSFSIQEWESNDSTKTKKLLEPGSKINYFEAPKHALYAFSEKSAMLQSIDLNSGDLIKFNLMEKEIKNLFCFNNQLILTKPKGYQIYNANYTKLIENVELPFDFERIYIDKNGNKWFGSFDKGIYFIRNQAPNFIDLLKNRNEGILSIVTDGDELIINTEKNGLLSLNSNYRCIDLLTDPTMNRMKGCVRMGEYQIVGTDNGLYRFNLKYKKPKLLANYAIKDIEATNATEALVGYSSGAIIYSSITNETIIIDKQRTTALIRIDSQTIWLGGLNGIRSNVQIGTKFTSNKLDLNEAINSSRIVDIKKDHAGNIWIATDQKGLFCYLPNGKINNYSVSTGTKLLSDVCLQILIGNDGSIWLATLAGVSIIQGNPNQNVKISNYTIADGMPGKSIRNIAFWNEKIIVVTPQGLYEFKTFPSLKDYTSNTVFLATMVNNKLVDPSKLSLTHKENNLVIRFASSFINTNSDYLFKYRVKQLSKDWILTNNLEVPLLGLEPGAYTFEIAAINAHNRSGPNNRLRFVINEPWYQSNWFKLAIVILALIIALYFYKSARTKLRMSKNLSLFRLRIMRAQMNPHFVFNSLSNIQYLIQKKKLEEAEEYIITLSGIMRNSIDYSGKEFIPLDKEIEYTQNYLYIEKQRFGDKFDYNIHTDLSIAEQSFIYVPPLILQPIVENAIKHAFKGLSEVGKIEIVISKTMDNYLNYVVRDNGVGFNYKPSVKINHGIDITKERLTILFKEMKKSSKFTILSNTTGKNRGTTISIAIPIIKD